MPASISNSSVISFAAMSPWSAADQLDRPDNSAPARTYLQTDNGYKRRCIESTETTHQATHQLQWDPDADLPRRVSGRGPLRDDSPPLERFKAGTLATPAIVRAAFHEDFQILLLNQPDLSDKALHKKMLGRYPTTDLDTVRELRARYATVEAAMHPADVLRSFETMPGLSPNEKQARHQDLQAWITGAMLRLDVKELPLEPPGHSTGPRQSALFRPASPAPSLNPPSIMTISDASEPQPEVQHLDADRTAIFFPPFIGLRSTQMHADTSPQAPSPDKTYVAQSPVPGLDSSAPMAPDKLPDAVPNITRDLEALDLDWNIATLRATLRNDPHSPEMPGSSDLDAYIQRPSDISSSDGQHMAP